MLFRLLTNCVVIPASVFSIIVRIEQGELNGVASKSRNGTEFYSFYAIPYALPPTGERRFQPPQGPPPSWNGIRDATEEPKMCLQKNYTRMFGYPFKNNAKSEDCLLLNVFTPDLAPSKPLPVLVYIHGGALAFGGSSMASPHYFLDKPLVMVTINYRLGIFGFFSTADQASPGNYGLKDQTAALIWVQKTISIFGGDPQAVTIMGQSAGAGSVQMHMFSPLSKGLFHKAIIHSGTAIAAWAYSSKTEIQSTLGIFLQFTNCDKTLTAESVDCLRALPGDKLQELTDLFLMTSSKKLSFRPTIEDANIEDAFLTFDPLLDLPFQQIPAVPAIFGITSNETAHTAQAFIAKHPKITEEIINKKFLDMLSYNIPDKPEVTKNITEQIMKIYFAGDAANVNIASLEALFSDFQINLSVYEGVKSYPGVRHFYEYDYKNSATKGVGACHSEDLKSFFPLKGMQLNDEDLKLSQELIKYWTNFIIRGNPNIPDGTVPTNWTTVTSFPAEYLHISKKGFIIKTFIDAEGKEGLWDYIKNAKLLKS